LEAEKLIGNYPKFDPGNSNRQPPTNANRGAEKQHRQNLPKSGRHADRGTAA
jgi:hypothetical protein